MGQSKAEAKLLAILTKKEKQFAIQQWLNKRFLIFKIISTTEKGDIGEDFLASLLEDLGYTDVQVIKSRRGIYDVSLKHNGKTILFEVKVATQDVHGAFQFNGVRLDRQYTHLFCLGISPAKIGYLIVARPDLMTPQNHLVSMAKDSNATFKLTKHANKLKSFDDFAQEIEGLVT